MGGREIFVVTQTRDDKVLNKWGKNRKAKIEEWTDKVWCRSQKGKDADVCWVVPCAVSRNWRQTKGSVSRDGDKLMCGCIPLCTQELKSGELDSQGKNVIISKSLMLMGKIRSRMRSITKYYYVNQKHIHMHKLLKRQQFDVYAGEGMGVRIRHWREGTNRRERSCADRCR